MCKIFLIISSIINFIFSFQNEKYQSRKNITKSENEKRNKKNELNKIHFYNIKKIK